MEDYGNDFDERVFRLEYFPIFISYCSIHYCLYGEVEENELIDGFFMYLTADER